MTVYSDLTQGSFWSKHRGGVEMIAEELANDPVRIIAATPGFGDQIR